MRYFPILLLGSILCPSPVYASNHAIQAKAAQHSPARNMVQSLNSMSALLNAVHSKAAADAATPQLLELYKEFRHLQTKAEATPPMTVATLHHHMISMDRAMNDFRMACARLMQEHCYGSSPMEKAVTKIARAF